MGLTDISVGGVWKWRVLGSDFHERAWDLKNGRIQTPACSDYDRFMDTKFYSCNEGGWDVNRPQDPLQ